MNEIRKFAWAFSEKIVKGGEKVKKLIVYLVVLFPGLLYFHFSRADNEEKILIMPDEIVKFAEANGYTQFEDFYNNRPGQVDPPYVYGYIPYDEWHEKYNSVAFWCKKIGEKDRKAYLIFARREGYFDFKIEDILEFWGAGGGLLIRNDTVSTLDEFYFWKTEKPGPLGIKLTHPLVISYYDGIATDFYKYNGEWLVRYWD